MSTTAYYTFFIAQLPPGLEQRVFEILARHVGRKNKISLKMLCREVLGAYSAANERKVRKAIEILRRDYRVPVMAQSGLEGRWLAESEDEIDETIKEMTSRRDHIDEVIRSLRLSVVPVNKPVFEKPVQGRLL